MGGTGPPVLARSTEYDALAVALSELVGSPSEIVNGPTVVASVALSTDALSFTPMLESSRIFKSPGPGGPSPACNGTTRPIFTWPSTPSETEPSPCTPASFWSPIGRLKSNFTGALVWYERAQSR